jgi:hypothetical protein
MASVTIREVVSNAVTNELKTKDISDNVLIEKKPESLNSGLEKNRDSTHEPDKRRNSTDDNFDNFLNVKPSENSEGPTSEKSDLAKSDYETRYSFILSDTPNLYKQIGGSMSSSFIKLIRSEKSDWLQENYPNAFLLLCLIAKRARRYNGHPDGLEIGMAYIGDYKKAGIETEKKYRLAKERLVKIGSIKILKTNRSKAIRATQKLEKSKKCKNEATSKATSGTIVLLLKSDIWDINPEDYYDLKGDLRATSGRPRGDKQEDKEDKKIDLIDTREAQGGILKDIHGNPIPISESEIYSAMLKYNFPTDVVKEAIHRAKNCRSPLRDVVRYVVKTCQNIQMENRKPMQFNKKSKAYRPEESPNTPPKKTGKMSNIGETLKKMEAEELIKKMDKKNES